jgi:hypothetical protein
MYARTLFRGRAVLAVARRRLTPSFRSWHTIPEWQWTAGRFPIKNPAPDQPQP